MYRVGIIGCGGIAQVHAAALQQLPQIEMIACADIRKERADAMAEKYGCHAYASMEGYGLFVTEVCRTAGLPYHHGEKTITFTACILY